MEARSPFAIVRWWIPVLRGILALVLGVVLIGWPDLGLRTLLYAFGLYAIVDGIFALATMIRPPPNAPPRWALALEGVAGLLAGGFVVTNPALSAVALFFVIAIWALSTGVLEILQGLRFGGGFGVELFLAGILSLLLGILMLWRPMAGAVALAWTLGFYAILFGVVLIFLGVRMRRITRPQKPRPV